MSEGNLESLKVVIPVGGEAKRLQPLTAEISKAVVRFLNRPIIEITLLNLAKQGVRNFIFGVKGYINYRSLHDYFKEGIGFSSRYGISPRVHMKYQPHVEDLGSADSFRIVADYYNINDSCAVIQGDNIFDLDLQDMLRFHLQKNAAMTIGLVRVRNVEGYGIAELDEDGLISRFVEKPKPEEAPSNYASAGIYIIHPSVKQVYSEERVQRTMESNRRLDFGQDFIPYLIESGRRVYGYFLKGDWYDLGTPEGYLSSMIEVLKKEKLEFEGRISKDETIWVEGQSPESLARKEEIIRKIRENAVHLEGAVLIGRHCSIGSATRIVDSCIDNFSIIGDGVLIENSAIMDRAIVKHNAQIRNSIVGRHVIINSSPEKPSMITGISIIGDDVRIGEGCTIISGRVRPHSVVPPNTMVVQRTFP